MEDKTLNTITEPTEIIEEESTSIENENPKNENETNVDEDQDDSELSDDVESVVEEKEEDEEDDSELSDDMKTGEDDSTDNDEAKGGININVEKNKAPSINAGGDINIGIEEIDTDDACPKCYTEIDASKYGKIVCPNPECGNVSYRRNTKLNITKFKTIDDKALQSKYHDIVGKINNNLIRKRYKVAYRYCLEAEDLAPREPTTWEYYTLVELYHDLKAKEKDIHDAIKTSKYNLEIAAANDVKNEKIEELKSIIAGRLYMLAKSNIGHIQSRSLRDKKYWGRGGGRKQTLSYLDVIKECFNLTEKTDYLEGYVDELSKPYKWMITSSDTGELKNLTRACRGFDAVGQRKKMIRLIQKTDENYEVPEIPIERIKINVIQNGNTSSPSDGSEITNQSSIGDGIKIISVTK